MNVTLLRALLERTLTAMPTHSDELRKLDAALGDGDLGITVGLGATAMRAAIAELPGDADSQAVIQAAAKAFARANPSTFAALISGGLLQAAKAAAGKSELGRDDAIELADTVATRIAERGKSQLGDKTILDALVPSIQILRAAGTNNEAALDAMIATAESQVEVTASLQSAKGRAAWLQARSVGHPDPGATAYLRFLQELRVNWSEAEASAQEH